MEKESNLVDLQQFKMSRSISVLIAKATHCRNLDTGFLYDVYSSDPDILVGITLDPFCDEAFYSLFSRYKYSYIIETSGKGITVIYSCFPLLHKVVLNTPGYPGVDIHNIIVGSDKYGLNFVFACGEMLSGIQNIEGIWAAPPASNGYLMLDYTYMIARNLEILQSDVPSDRKEQDLKLIYYKFRIKEKSDGEV